MRSSNIGYFLLAGIVFTMPGCTIQAHVDDDTVGDEAGSGGHSGATGGSSGKGGSAGQGGTGGSAGTAGGAASGGTSGASEGGAAGAGDEAGAAGSAETGDAGAAGAGGSVSASCDTSGFEFPEVTCETGSMNELTNATCQDVFLCMGLADCAASNMDCAQCLDYLKVAFTKTDTCIHSATQATLAEACTSIAEGSANQYPQCVPK